MLDANCTTELATLVPEAGGPYVFVRAAYGDFAGFVVGWGDWLQNSVALAFVAVALAESAGALAPSLAGIAGPACAPGARCSGGRVQQKRSPSPR